MSDALRRLREELDAEYERRFPRSRAHFRRHAPHLLDGTSHAIRWNEPFMPVARRAEGPFVDTLDGRRLIDYWQGHFANILGHNPPLIARGLREALDQGRGLQSGMLHELEGQVSELICRLTGSETVRLTTSGSLGTFYAVILARAFTKRELVLKVSGGWHGSQPFGLKGVSPKQQGFEHLESEGLSASTGAEIVLTRFNDTDDLRATFAAHADRIACFLLEPVLGAGGGMVASPEYMQDARRLTEEHGALLLSDEIITGFRFRAGDATSMYGVRPDLLILGKILGGGMPVAAVAGRGDVLALATRTEKRVKFEGGTYSAHELSLVAARTMLAYLEEREDELYPALGKMGRRLEQGLAEAAERVGVPLHRPLAAAVPLGDSSLVLAHVMARDGASPVNPEQLARDRHPEIDERLMKSMMLLEDVSSRTGVGAVSTAHGEAEIDRTVAAFEAVLARLKKTLGL